MLVISNSSPLIALAQIGRLDFPCCRRGLPSARLAQRRRPEAVSYSIGPGEHEVISLGLELRAERRILDEQPARRLATAVGRRVIGTVGLLLMGKDRGLLT